MQVRVPAEIGEFRSVRAEIEAFCHAASVPDTVIYRIVLMLEELFTNVVMHGETASEVTISLRRLDGHMTIEFRDNGGEFDPFSVDDRSMHDDLDYRPVGKLGVPLVRALTSKRRFARRDGWNYLMLEVPVGRNA